jgi:hypothetical protein
MGTEFRYERPGPNGSVAVVSGHGKPAFIDGSNAGKSFVPMTIGNFPAHLPAVVLASELNNPKVQLEAIQRVTAGGAAAIQVSTDDETDEFTAKITRQDWYFDATTLLPMRVDYVTTNVNNLEDLASMTALLSDYRSQSGMLIPFHIVIYFNGQQIEDIVLSQVLITNSIPAADFDAPAVSAGGVK